MGSVPYEKNIDWVDYLETPFVMGVMHPKIYLPSTLENQELTYILAHEEHHIKRRDYLIKPIAFFALCLHWFNPLVWLSFFLFCEDMEMSCDEAVIRKLGENVRTSYAESLLSIATGRHILTATPLAFGEGYTKGRIRNMKNWKKPVLWIVVLSVVACILLGAFLLTNHKELQENPEGLIDTAQVIESLDAQLIAANYMQEGRKSSDGELLVWDETSITEITVQNQPCYAMALCFSEHTDHCYGTFAVSKDGKTVYQENPDADTEDARWQKISENGQNSEPVTEPFALTEDSANQCMIQILESFLVQEDGTVSFSVPNPLPTSNEKNAALNITLHASYQTEDQSSTTQNLLKNEKNWKGGEIYTDKLDLQLGELERIFLRVAFSEEFTDGWKDVCPAKYIELTAPFAYGEPIHLIEDTISASQSGENVIVNMTFADASPAQIAFTLPDGVSLSTSNNNSDPFEYLLIAEDGNEIGNMIFMDLAADEAALKNVTPSKNELPMQVYAGIALPNHIMYENYVVQTYGKTNAAATAQVSSQDLDLLGEEYDAAVAIPFANEKNVVLFYDYEKIPVFMQIAFDKDAISSESCAEIAKSITIQ